MGGGGFRCITEFSLAEAEAVTTTKTLRIVDHIITNQKLFNSANSKPQKLLILVLKCEINLILSFLWDIFSACIFSCTILRKFDCLKIMQENLHFGLYCQAQAKTQLS